MSTPQDRRDLLWRAGFQFVMEVNVRVRVGNNGCAITIDLEYGFAQNARGSGILKISNY